jgi:hypothetical protein
VIGNRAGIMGGAWPAGTVGPEPAARHHDDPVPADAEPQELTAKT